jgi:glutamate mutase epsilon subunit
MKMNLSNDQKAAIYDSLIFRYQRLQEEVRQIKAKNFEVSEQDQRKINEIEQSMRTVYNQAQRLF